MRLITLLLLAFSCTLTAGDSMIDRRLREAVMAMAANQVPGAPSPLERGVRLLVTDGAMEDQFDAVMKAFGAAFTLLGTPQAVEEVAVRSYGTRSELAYFVIPCQRGVAFVRIASLKRGDNQRIVSSLTVGVRPEAVFPPALLEPEIKR
ncbi:MAG: hypothetical protein H0W78_00015 [Planctomycetes bacterium]|nr:hypothetical protein [Planctomycetota bacterium]